MPKGQEGVVMNIYTSKELFEQAQAIIAEMNAQIRTDSQIRFYKAQLKAIGARAFWDSYCNEWMLSTRLA